VQRITLPVLADIKTPLLNRSSVAVLDRVQGQRFPFASLPPTSHHLCQVGNKEMWKVQRPEITTLPREFVQSSGALPQPIRLFFASPSAPSNVSCLAERLDNSQSAHAR
jgi:hypothetical protein